MNRDIGESWSRVINGEFEKPYYRELEKFVDDAFCRDVVYPKEEAIFAAFRMTAFEDVKVVILGQDPYHEPEQAQGLAFYVPNGVATPPSLANIAKELFDDICRDEKKEEEFQLISEPVKPKVPNLLSWAEQGVLLLNATLTVSEHEPLSHRDKGWEEFTDAVIRLLSETRDNLVFILWGKSAQEKGRFINREKHCVLESAHPSPLSAYRGFWGSKPFSKTNAYLREHNITPIKWG